MMTFSRCLFHFLAGAVCLHYSCAATVCPGPTYACSCPFGSTLVTDSNGCEVCSCLSGPTQCPQLDCLQEECPNGFATNENGCPSCECKPTCPTYMCKCPFGSTLVTDSNGCEVCSCLSGPTQCPQLNCLQEECPNGFATDENGCPSCQCKPTTFPCKIRKCYFACPNGFQTDSNGCTTCQCKSEICPEPSCPLPETCDSEFVQDEGGCTICRCKCPEPICETLRCAYGLETNDAGCSICQCRTQALL